ncbi:Mu transposase C-terminal domain-containing protein, partial [Marinovum sp. PR37]
VAYVSVRISGGSSVFEVLEELYLKSDRISVSLCASRAEKLYRDKCKELGIDKPNACAKKSFMAILGTLRADDVIKARNDTETSKKLRLQGQFYARVNYPLDLVEIDTTPANVHLRDRNGIWIGRPTVSVAIDAATGFVLGLRLSLDAPNEILTVQTLKDVMTPRADDFFDRHGIENRLQVNGVGQILSCDHGSENTGKWLPWIIAHSGMELAKNIPGCPEKKPFVERFNLELSRFFETLPGATTSPTMPNKTRTEKAMVEACMTLEELESHVYKWLYDVYAKKVRRLIHSPLRVPESPTDSWNRLMQGIPRLPLGPEEIAQIFMVEEGGRKLQHYGIDVRGVQYHSKGLGELVSTLGRKATVDVRYDPTDIRAIAVVHDVEGIENPLIVPAKSEDIAPISFDDVKRIKSLSPEAKEQDLEARSKMYDIALAAQKLAEGRGKGKISNVRKLRRKEVLRQKAAEMKARAATTPLQSTSAKSSVNQPTPRLAVRRREQRPEMDILE